MDSGNTEPKRILMASEFWFGSTGSSLANGFRQLGWDVLEVNLGDHFVQGDTLKHRLASRFLRRASQASFNREIVKLATNFRPQLFLTIKGNYISCDSLSTLSGLGVKAVNYYPDVHFEHPGLDQKSLHYYDHFITVKSFQLDHLYERLGREKVHFLPHGYSSLVHRPRSQKIAEEAYDADVLYVGNHSPYKQKWLAAIAKKLPDVKLKIVGSNWGAHAPEFGPNAAVTPYPVPGDSFARLLEHAKINVAVHFGPTGPNGWEDFVSSRTFEIPACKGFMLHIDNPEVRGLFKVGEEIDVFATEDELCEKISFYLENDDRRRAMVEAAYARTVPAYSFDARTKAILDIASGAPTHASLDR